jgi:aryl-alcohol dehydrogenase-like predicted oxidoreductase
VDAIDLYQVHWPDPNTPFAETAGALAGLVAEGKIRHAGVSNFDADQMEVFAKDGPLETLQPPYHMFRRAIEDTVLPYCRTREIGVLVYGPLAHGLLTGAMHGSTRFAPDDWRSASPDFTGETFRRNLEVVDALKRFATDRDLSLPVLAMAWALANPAVDAAIVGTSNPAHLTDAISAVDVRLSPEDLAQIDRILAGSAPVHGPAPEAMPST